MKKLIRNIVMIAAIAIYVWLFFILELWRISPTELKTGWGMLSLVVIITIFGLIISCIGMIFGKKVFEKSFIVFNILYLVFGIYMVYFAWTFYIFEIPTFLDRLAHTRNALAFGVLMPLLLFYYLEKKNG